jgi:hypothetical protein
MSQVLAAPSSSFAPPENSPQQLRDQRATNRALVALAIGATIVLDWVLASLPGVYPQLVSLLFLGVGLAQVALAAGWAVLGQTYWFARLWAPPAVAVVLSQLLAPKVIPDARELMGFLMLFAAGVALPLAVLRCAGLVVVSRPERGRMRVAGGWRFSLSGLFALTTTVALMIAVAQGVGFPPREHLISVLAYVAAFAVTALISLVIFLGSHVWSVAAGATAGALVIGWGTFAAIRTDEIGLVACVALFESLFLTAAAFVFQLSGRRLAWIKTKRHATLPRASWEAAVTKPR